MQKKGIFLWINDSNTDFRIVSIIISNRYICRGGVSPPCLGTQPLMEKFDKVFSSALPTFLVVHVINFDLIERARIRVTSTKPGFFEPHPAPKQATELMTITTSLKN